MAGLSKNGLMSAGLFHQLPTKIYLESGATHDLGSVNGFVGVVDSYSWDGIAIYWCSGNNVELISGAPYSSPVTVKNEGGKYLLFNSNTNKRGYSVFVQNITFYCKGGLNLPTLLHPLKQYFPY